MTIRTRFGLSAIALLGSFAATFAGATAYAAEPVPALQLHHQAWSKLSSDASGAANANPSGTVRVIVQWKTGDMGTKLNTLARVGGAARYHFKTSSSAAVEVPASTLESLANDDNVAYVSYDRPLGPKAAQSSIATSAEYTTDAINAPAVWAKGFLGAGVGVAVIDSGVQNEPDLNLAYAPGSRIVYSAAFPSNMPGGTGDQYGHGTHVAGLIAGNGAKSYGTNYTRSFFGVAPGANIINLRVLDTNGQGTDSAVIQAIEAAIQLKSTYNIRVINLSLGRPVWESYTQDPLCQAVEAAWKAGIVVVAAAGNDGRNQTASPEGYGTINAPGNDPYVITVGAMNTVGTKAITDDILGSYSSKGPSFADQIAKPDLVAPGNLVTSLVATGGETLRKNNPTFFTPTSFYQNNGKATQNSPDYMPLSGTSMSTGVVSGAVALLLSADPLLTPDQVKAVLMLSANHSNFPTTSSVTDPTTGITYTAHYDALSVGAGYLDINAALVAANSAGSLPAGTAMSPVVNYDPTQNAATLAADASAMWNANSALAPANVYGPNAFVDGTTALWGRATLTGASDPNAFTALWGATALWGRSTPDAATALWGRSAGAGDVGEGGGTTDSAASPTSTSY